MKKDDVSALYALGGNLHPAAKSMLLGEAMFFSFLKHPHTEFP